MPDEHGTAVGRDGPADDHKDAKRPAATGLAGRRPELDLMRAFVVAGLVVFHSAMVFSPGSSWFVTDAHPDTGFAAFVVWGSLWGIPLLFTVSGVGAWYALGTRSAVAFARERLARLLVPFITGLVLLVPPMFYVARLAHPAFDEPYWRFWASFLDLPAMATGLLARGSWTSGNGEFDPAHLWFLYVLLVISLVTLPLLTFLRSPRGTRRIAVAANFAMRHPLPAVAASAAPVMVVEAVFGPDTDTGGWERSVYLLPFLYGFVIASDPRFETALARSRCAALGTALPATAALIAWADGTAQAGGSMVGWGALQGLAGWAWLAAILGFAASLTTPTRQGRVLPAAGTDLPCARRRQSVTHHITDAVLPFYLLHEPVIVLVAWFVVRWQTSTSVKYTAVVLVSATLTLALYEVLIRPFAVPRTLLGMKDHHRAYRLLAAVPQSHAEPGTNTSRSTHRPITPGGGRKKVLRWPSR